MGAVGLGRVFIFGLCQVMPWPICFPGVYPNVALTQDLLLFSNGGISCGYTNGWNGDGTRLDCTNPL